MDEGEKMNFYVYENWVAEKKAVIHRGECSFCNNGDGIHPNIHGEKNGRWHGPFDSYEEARGFAEGLRDREVRDCKFCLRETRETNINR